MTLNADFKHLLRDNLCLLKSQIDNKNKSNNPNHGTTITIKVKNSSKKRNWLLIPSSNPPLRVPQGLKGIFNQPIK